MSVTSENPLFAANLPQWQLVEDICAGEYMVKYRGEIYLPKPNPLDHSPENKERYCHYLKRAVLYETTGNTLDGLVGAAFRVDPVLTVPDELRYLSEDADGTGVSIYQQSQSALSHLLMRGRVGLLVDMPVVDKKMTVAQQKENNIRCQIIMFNAKQIINWQTSLIGSKHLLSLVVIKESSMQASECGFIANMIDQYRVLRLINGVYNVEIWQMTEDEGTEGWNIVNSYIPTDGNGKTWNQIPFTFVGATNNDPTPDRIPLLRIATVNLAHYRNSADYEDSVFITGQPQPWMTGIDPETRDYYRQPANKISIGSREIFMLPAGGGMGFAQAAPNTLVERAMKQKEDQMVALGARLVEVGTVAKTATESRSHQRVQHSVLTLCVANLSEAYTHCLDWVAQFMKVTSDDDMLYSINQDFVESGLNPQDLQQVVVAWQQGLLPRSDAWQYMRKSGLISTEKTDEAISDELEAEFQAQPNVMPALGVPDAPANGL